MRGPIPHAAESESRPRGGRHAQLEAAVRHLASGLRPMGIFAKTVLREQAPGLPGAVFTNISAWLNFRKNFPKSPCIFRKHPV